MSALQNIRKGLSSTGSSIIVAVLIFGLVATFGGFLTDPSAPSNSPLKINGKNISFGEYNLEFSRLSTLFSEGEVSEELINEITRNSIISKELVYQKALDLRINVSDDFVNSLISNDTSFQTNGEFDTSLFSGYMARLGLTVNDYRELVKSKYLANSLSDFISRSEFSLDSSALNFIQATNQQRSLSFFKLDLTEIAEKEIIPDSEILNYYQQNQFKFIEPKKIAIDYILLNENFFKDTLEVSPQEILDERNLLEEGDDNSQTRVSHIQLSFSSEEEKQEKLETANLIIKKLSDSITFESLVEEYSDDFGSNSNGGDLGYTDGTILPEEFELQIKNLSINDVSQIIEMPGSIHILKVTEKNNFLFSDDEIKDMILSNKSQEILNETLLNIEDNSLSSFLKYIIRELITNTIDHSDSVVNTVCAGQLFPNIKQSEIVVVDCGVGFFNTLKKRYGTLKDDADAVELALEKGTSGITTRNSRHNAYNKNAGYGLYVISRIVKEFGGILKIISKNGVVSLNNSCITKFNNDDILWRGSIVIVRLKQENFRDINLDDFLRKLRMEDIEQEDEELF
jgi:parvulin-like peptidyl-prolyl isomerase